MKHYIRILFWRSLDVLGSPLTLLASLWLKLLRPSLNTSQYTPLAGKIYSLTGLLPVPDHYYQPLVNPGKHLKRGLNAPRTLPTLQFNDTGQLSLLNAFSFEEELLAIPLNKTPERKYFYNNGSFEAGDSEYLYQMIRYYKPAHIIEIGCGFSTLMATEAKRRNREDDPAYSCAHICIEPYEVGWLEQLDVTVIRENVENVKAEVFSQLGANDILFIDSSHVIRPQGDVLFEYFEILPSLKSGVIIHIHDIFTPHDYPHEWIYEDRRLWNEQYLLEAFLSYNNEFKIIGSLSYLFRNYRDELLSKCPVLRKQQDVRYPGSFWIQKI